MKRNYIGKRSKKWRKQNSFFHSFFSSNAERESKKPCQDILEMLSLKLLKFTMEQ
jgi:hypothetical protein